MYWPGLSSRSARIQDWTMKSGTMRFMVKTHALLLSACRLCGVQEITVAAVSGVQLILAAVAASSPKETVIFENL